MNKRTVIAIVAMLMMYSSCGKNSEKETQELRQQIIAVHDEVMPMMGKLMELEKQALKEAKGLESTEPVDSVKMQQLKKLAVQLKQAREGMFVWMRQYEKEDGEKTDEEVRTYLDDQMDKVTRMSTDILTALSLSDSLLSD